MKLGSKQAKLVRLMQKLVPRRRVGIFRNECTRSIPFDPNLMFRWVLCCLGASGIVSSPYETRFKMGRTGAMSAKDCAKQSRWNILQRTHPIHPIGP